MSDLESRLAELEQRVQTLQDELEVHRVIVTYGLAVDIGDADRTANVYTEDTVFEVDGRSDMAGRKGVREMVLGSGHQSLLPNCAHTIGPAVVKVDGDQAYATGYSRIYHRQGDDYNLFRVSMNRWRLERRDGRWQIAHRQATMIGNPGAHDIFRAGLRDLEG